MACKIITRAILESKKLEVCYLKLKSPQLAQLCANMARVSGFPMEKVLEKGFVVEEINIYAVLVSHSNMYCVPMNCNGQVNKNTSFMKGDELFFDEALHHVLMLI